MLNLLMMHLWKTTNERVWKISGGTPVLPEHGYMLFSLRGGNPVLVEAVFLGRVSGGVPV